MSIFSQVKTQKVGRNTFDLSHQRKMSAQIGQLTPVLCVDLVPGDKFKISTSQMLRFAPLIAPVMHQVSVYTHFFFVPNRILWKNWGNFITGGEDGNDTSVFPTVKFLSAATGSLVDYLGLPLAPSGTNEINVSALPMAAYQEIYNEYYRDQNLIEKVDTDLQDGDNGPLRSELIQIRQRAWQHDYFTSALPWTQKGAEATIPLGTTAPINYINSSDGQGAVIVNSVTGVPAAIGGVETFQKSVPEGTRFRASTAATTPLGINNASNLQADLSGATAATINDLRSAFRLQEWLERNARGGSRYSESILSHFGVKSSDARLQRPEFLGGASAPVSISEVLQTSNSSFQTGDIQPSTPQANMAGHGISVGGSNSISYYAEEHGQILCLLSVMPKTAYQQGIPKNFLKFDKFDYYWPSFAHLGEQAIENKEIYFGADQANSETFGYTPRYAEYKYMNDTVHGEFRQTLRQWHMGRLFANRPQLNKEFIECKEDDVKHIFAVQDSETLYIHVNHRIKASRKMPYFGTPTF